MIMLEDFILTNLTELSTHINMKLGAKMNRLSIFILLLFTLTVLPFTLSARDKIPAIDKLSKNADVILTGKVTKKLSAWNANKTRIYTKATLKVDDLLKGPNNGSTIDVVYPGGEIGEVGELYTHMPRFTEEEEVLVFLKKDHKKNEFKVLNGEDGKFTVIRDDKTKQKVTSSNVRIEALKKQIKEAINTQK